jgi:hypothetical protein
MALPYRVDSLDDVPEAARPLYEEKDGAFVLPVTGVETPDDVAGLKSALAKLKRNLAESEKKAGRVSDDDVAELQQLRSEAREREEKQAKEEGRWEDLRTKLLTEEAGKRKPLEDKLSQYEQVIERLTVTNELRTALSEAGFDPGYHEAVEALLERRGPKVIWDGEMPKGVFPDEVHGDQPIMDYVSAFAKTKDAEKYLPPKVASGGGATGADSKGVDTTKPWGEMTPDEKVAYTEAKYGGQSAA